MKRLIKFIFLGPLWILASCVDQETIPTHFENYYIPIYAPKNEAFGVRVEAARPLENPGRIYVKNSLLIINERYKGYHLIDNTNPEQPKPLLFLAVPGALNLAMQGNYLYADNLSDLITIDLTNLQAIKEVNRQKEVLGKLKDYPPFQNIGFECVDPARGVVVGWAEAPLPDGDIMCWR